MNYLNKMNVGDIVISNTGNIGYVSNIYRDNDTFSWIKVYDSRGDCCPMGVASVKAEEIPRWFTQIGATKIKPFNTCTDCNRDYDIDDRLDTLNSNLVTLLEKLDQIIQED